MYKWVLAKKCLGTRVRGVNCDNELASYAVEYIDTPSYTPHAMETGDKAPGL